MRAHALVPEQRQREIERELAIARERVDDFAQCVPSPIHTVENFAKIECAKTFVCAVTESGYVCVFGAPTQRGAFATVTEEEEQTSVPEARVIACAGSSEKVMSVAVGSDFLCLVLDGTLFVLGVEKFGELGQRSVRKELTVTNSLRKVDMQLFDNLPPLRVSQVAAGARHTLILTEDGRAYGCGYNGYGNLGLGSINVRVSTPAAVQFSPYAGRDMRRVVEVGAGETTSWFRVAMSRSLRSIDDRDEDDIVLYMCGSNKFGCCGFPDRVSRHIATYTPVEVSRGDTQRTRRNVVCVCTTGKRTIVALSDGAIRVVGMDESGNLGAGLQDVTYPRWTPATLSKPSFRTDRIVCAKRETYLFDSSCSDFFMSGNSGNATFVYLESNDVEFVQLASHFDLTRVYALTRARTTPQPPVRLSFFTEASYPPTGEPASGQLASLFTAGQWTSSAHRWHFRSIHFRHSLRVALLVWTSERRHRTWSRRRGAWPRVLLGDWLRLLAHPRLR